MKTTNQTNKTLAADVSEECYDQLVNIITSDGHILVGTLKGMDNQTNLILDDSHERVFSLEQGFQKHQLGLCLIRGENVALIGQVDRKLDLDIDISKCKAPPLKPVVH